jgi:hypothetical protein
MSAKHQDAQKQANQSTIAQQKSSCVSSQVETPQRHAHEKEDALRKVDKTAQKAQNDRPDRTAGQNGAIDEKRNDEQQYHAGGAAHDPHNRIQERVDSGDPDAGDVDEETRSSSAPFNKTYGRHP